LLTHGSFADKLSAIEVQAGDSLQLLVLPKASHAFDTTVVELKIATTDGSMTWDLAADIVDNLHQGNPHADRLGHANVWHFLDMAASKRGQQARGTDNTALESWRAAVEGVRAGKLPHKALHDAAERVQEDVSGSTGTGMGPSRQP
jgi:hypothetical protein